MPANHILGLWLMLIPIAARGCGGAWPQEDNFKLQLVEILCYQQCHNFITVNGRLSSPASCWLESPLNYTRVAGLFITVSGNPKPRRRRAETKAISERRRRLGVPGQQIPQHPEINGCGTRSQIEYCLLIAGLSISVSGAACLWQYGHLSLMSGKQSRHQAYG